MNETPLARFHRTLRDTARLRWVVAHPHLVARAQRLSRATLALLLAGCAEQRIDAPEAPAAPPRDVYVVISATAAERGASIVEAIARCDDGDQVLAGGCTWGESADPADLPLYPMTDAPDGLDGWRCRGRNGGVGTHPRARRGHGGLRGSLVKRAAWRLEPTIREGREARVWQATHADFRDETDGVRRRLIQRDGGTLLCPLGELTETEIDALQRAT